MSRFLASAVRDGVRPRHLVREVLHAGPRRCMSEAVTASPASLEGMAQAETREGWLFVDSVFPVRLGTWDIRYHLGSLREETLLERLQIILSSVKTHDFRVVSLEPHAKDGGVFVKFQYSAGEPQSALDTIIRDLRATATHHGGTPSWSGLLGGNIWLVKGRPWREDMSRYASPIIKVAFEGPDVKDEILYELLRPFGRIQDVTEPTPVPPGVLRSSTVTFSRLRSAAIARNTIHGATIPPSPSAPTLTTLRTAYQKPIQAHAVRDYIASHPRIFLPVLFFFIGTLTYTIFDPIRVLTVEGKLEGWFDFRDYGLYKWLQRNAFDRLSFTVRTDEDDVTSPEGVWDDRREAEDALERYLSDLPNTVALVHGPQGSGKSRMLNTVLKETSRKALVIDVAELSKAGSDAVLVSSLAYQTGYWPVFSFLNSVNNLIDLASVGLIGQKTGLSSSLSDQLKQILEVVGTGLSRVNVSHRERRDRVMKEQERAELRKEAEAVIRERIRKGIWHDGRLDCVAGNGVISELGIGDERLDDLGADDQAMQAHNEEKGRFDDSEKAQGMNDMKWNQNNADDLQSMPIVIIKGFESKGGGQRREELLDVLSQWAATLVENQVAHVVVVSDNRENAKRLAKALPSQPLNLIALSDADDVNAMIFVRRRLQEVNIEVEFNPEEVSYIQRLGGRASDLESLVHKARSGLTIQEAVEDIVARSTAEIQKNAFGDDLEDAKNLPWTREQVWILMKQLSTKPEISYHEVLMDFPFKGDETPLRNMEQAELIAVSTQNGRPSSIKPGKPVYKYVFERLVQDPVFKATQDITFNEKVIASSETIVKACEAELLTLRDVENVEPSWLGGSVISRRASYLAKKMRAAQHKIEALEKQNADLKKILSRGG
ncbi:hypothetical protein OBBRIDRAFT_878653 [Obba rivulosa]|uniref:Mitochondrial escape protein 2 n=1 Tax=Obba rivulosa TaxID=1052685 RepID=A0A8E2J7M0_9APHY|nr:hypothetical protein OBBRIDRAFT_878653 [Obba rivulosa]